MKSPAAQTVTRSHFLTYLIAALRSDQFLCTWLRICPCVFMNVYKCWLETSTATALGFRKDFSEDSSNQINQLWDGSHYTLCFKVRNWRNWRTTNPTKCCDWHHWIKRYCNYLLCITDLLSTAGVFNLWGAPPQGGASTCQGGREHQLIQRHCLEDLWIRAFKSLAIR